VSEIAALRETAKELLADERFADCFQKHQLSVMAKGVLSDSVIEELNNVSIESIKKNLLS
jgi:hypothetical protein